MISKKWKQAAAWLLAGALFMGAAGCGNSANTEVNGTSKGNGEGEAAESAQGRYVETQKQTPEGLATITDMTRLSDGSIAIVDLDTGASHISSDNGDSWRKKELPALAEKISEQTEIQGVAVAPDGGVFFSYVDWGSYEEDTTENDAAQTQIEIEDEESTAMVVSDDGSTIEEHYMYINADGTAKELNLAKGSLYLVFFLSDSVFMDEKTVIAMDIEGSYYQIDVENETIEKMEDMPQSLNGIMFAKDYLLSTEKIYQLSTDEAVEDTVLKEFIGQETSGYKTMGVCLDGEKNQLYLASASGLYSHVPGGSTMEKLLDGGLSNLGDPTKSVAALLKNEDGSFLVAYEDGEIDQYTYDEEAPSVPSQQLTIYTLKQNTTVSKAISIFRKNHPDIYVKQEIGMSGDYGVTEEDAIKNLNTRLLAGEGPDILILDGMPMDSYVEKEMLADLGTFADGLEEKNAYFSNILRAYQTEDGLYAVPIRYSVPILIGNASEMEGISNLTQFAERVEKLHETHSNATTMLGTYTPEELLERLYMTSSPAFGQGKELDKNAVKEFLEQADKMYKTEQKNVTDEMLEQHTNMTVWNDEHGLSEENPAFGIDTTCAFEMVGGTQVFAAGALSSMEDFQMLNGILGTKENTAFAFLPGQSEKVFSPKGIVGINAQTKEKELALSFMEILLGEEVQKADLGDGFPVNADAFDSFAQTSDPDAQIGFVASTIDEDTGKESRVEFIADWPSEEKITALKEMIASLVTPTLSDETIKNAVMETGAKVLEGSLSIDEGCDEIVQKVELYLAE